MPVDDQEPTEDEYASFEPGMPTDLLSGDDEDGEEILSPVTTPDVELPEFDPRWRQDFDGLMFVGALKKRFSYLGHDFVIKTMTLDEIFTIGVIHRPYVGTLAEVKAYQAAVVAACIVTIDGKIPPLPITDADDDTKMIARFDYIRRHWFPPVLDVIYDQYLQLEIVVDEVIASLGEA